MATETKEKAVVFYLPEMRVINASLFERDAFTPEKGQPGAPKYKIELAGDKADLRGEGTIEDKLADALAADFGEQTAQDFLDGVRSIISPFLSGDTLAANRAEKGKEGDAYKGKVVVRADTAFNKDGNKDAGGIYVVDADNNEIGFANKGEIYSGCYGVAAVTISTYKDYPRTGDRGVKFYLSGFQKTRDGEKLVQSEGKTNLFKPLNRPGAAATAGAGRTRTRGA